MSTLPEVTGDAGGDKVAPSDGPSRGAHTAITFGPTGELLDAVLPFLRDGLAGGDLVTVSLGADRLRLVRDALGIDSAAVTWLDTYEWEPQPVRRLRAFDELLETAAPGQRLRVVGESAWPDGPLALQSEWVRADALLSAPLAASGAEVLCVYDRNRLPAEVVEQALRAHPFLGSSPRQENGNYHRAEQVALALAGPFELPDRALRSAGKLDPTDVRSFLRSALPETALSVSEEELLLIASELVANSCQAGADAISVAIWAQDGFVCLQVEDDADGFDDPLAGYRLPPPDAPSGRGLGIVRMLAAATEITSSPLGTKVRVYLAPR